MGVYIYVYIYFTVLKDVRDTMNLSSNFMYFKKKKSIVHLGPQPSYFFSPFFREVTLLLRHLTDHRETK